MSLSELVIRGLVSEYNVSCSACGTRFRRSGLRVIGHEQDVFQVSARCPHCQTVSVLTVKLDTGGLVTSLELTSDEQQRFASSLPVSADDVLDVAEFLATFDGDFKALFAQAVPEDSAPPADDRATSDQVA